MNFKLPDLVGTFIGAALIALVVACNHNRDRSRSEGGECINNLRYLGGGYAQFAADHGAPLTKVSTNSGGTAEFVNQPEKTYTHFSVIVSNYLYPILSNTLATGLVCPLDDRRAGRVCLLGNSNISYFLSVNAPAKNGGWILSGNRNLKLKPGTNPDQPDRQACWDARAGLHRTKGYVLLLDGSVSLVDGPGIQQYIRAAGNATNDLAFP